MININLVNLFLILISLLFSFSIFLRTKGKLNQSISYLICFLILLCISFYLDFLGVNIETKIIQVLSFAFLALGFIKLKECICLVNGEKESKEIKFKRRRSNSNN